MHDISPAERPGEAEIQAMFGYLTSNTALSRREAISTIARKYAMSSREVYKTIESSKK
jgi:hypothetical protein